MPSQPPSMIHRIPRLRPLTVPTPPKTVQDRIRALFSPPKTETPSLLPDPASRTPPISQMPQWGSPRQGSGLPWRQLLMKSFSRLGASVQAVSHILYLRWVQARAAA